MKITLDNKVLDAFNMKYVTLSERTFDGVSGYDHYRLLQCLGSQFSNSLLFDIGTRTGASAIAMAQNPTNQVHSFDIKNTNPVAWKNVVYHVGNIMDMAEWKAKMLTSPLISLDVDPHDGGFEQAFLDFLSKNSYKGMLYMDDINLDRYPKLRALWNSITLKKVDVTKYGHFSGSGLVLFDPTMEIEMV
jgi:hypothetical protein